MYTEPQMLFKGMGLSSVIFHISPILPPQDKLLVYKSLQPLQQNHMHCASGRGLKFHIIAYGTEKVQENETR